MLPVSQFKICFSIPASPTDNFYSQIAMFRLALNALGGVYKKAHIILSLAADEISPLPDRWKPYFGDTVKFNWADPQFFLRSSYRIQGDIRWKYDHDEYDVVIFCDADTLLVNPINDLLIRIQQSPAVMGVIAHYPFALNIEEDNNQAWSELAMKFAEKPIDFKYRYSLRPEEDLSTSASCPFYLNFGFVAMTPKIIKTIKNTYLTLHPKIYAFEKIKYPVFSGQIALTLSLLAHDVPTYELGLRYNFPNDPIADHIRPKELEDVRLIHYLRTDQFDRQVIFVNKDAFNDFLLLKLDGSNKVFQDHIRKLTNGRYPFHYKQTPFSKKGEQDNKAWKIALLFRQIRVLIIPANSFFSAALLRLINGAFFLFRKIRINQKVKDDLALIKSSNLFVEDWYLANNLDVATIKMDPTLHYLQHGGFEGRDPGPYFSSDWYLNTYNDIKKAGVNPLVHYLRFGKEEGRNIKFSSKLS